MLTSAFRSVQPPICQQRFERILSAICRDSRPRLGLAVSGGVDSMALASLCSRIENSSENKPHFTAFVVNHGLRHGSDVEAANVASLLKQMEIDCEVLELDWGDTHNPNQLPNLESMARKLRFQALGRACRDSKITSLLLAHHGNDQAETVMSRILTGYIGFGLRGIKAEANIPECHGIYGVSESGHPRQLASDIPGSWAEEGGVSIHRPLLAFTKDELIATCEQRGVKWFEDVTNADKTLTIRNTIRHLHQTNALPSAFQAESLRRVAENKEEQYMRFENAADAIFNESKIELDICSGIVSVKFPSDIEIRLCAQESRANARYTAALLMRRLSMLADASSVTSLQDTQQAVQCTFPFLFEETVPVQTNVCLGSLGLRKHLDSSGQHDRSTVLSLDTALYHRHPLIQSPAVASNSLEVTIYPRPPTQVGKNCIPLTTPEKQRHASVDPVWTDTQLFDGRFWLSIRYRPFNITPGRHFVLRHLTKEDICSVRTADVSSRMKMQIGQPDTIHKSRFEALIKHHAPDLTRFALPVIVERYQIPGTNGELLTKDVPCALPSIGWGRPGWRSWDGKDSASDPWRFDCKYKMVDFGTGKDHSVKGPPSRKGKIVRADA